MEYDEPAEVVAADAAAFQKLMLTVDRSTMCLIASQLSRAYRSGRNRGRNEGFDMGFSVGMPL